MADLCMRSPYAPGAGVPQYRLGLQRMPKLARARRCAAVGRAGQYR